MATNLLAPTGFVYARNLLGAAPTYQANVRYIQRSYGTAIGFGDVVSTSSGYVVQGLTGNYALGIFVGVLPYYDINLAQTAHGLNGSYPASGVVPPTGVDVSCLVIQDPFAVFRVQYSGGPWSNAWIGNNCALVTGTPNAAGISTQSVGSQATTSTLPFRIVGLVGVSGGPQDPANTNPWIEVTLNPGIAEALYSTGV